MDGLELPGGAEWVTADLGEAMEALGIDAAGLAELMRHEPRAAGRRASKAAGSVKTIGEEKVNGVETVHLRGTVKFSDYLAGAAGRPAQAGEGGARGAREARRRARRQSLDAPTPIDMWVDEDKLVRRMTQGATIPAQKGVPGGKMTMTLDLSDFGTKLDLPRPAEDDV